MPTELVWEGKYDSARRKVAPPRIPLPFQTVETVNESAQERQKMLDLFAMGTPPAWRNRLIWGDKKYVLPALLDEFAGQVDLVYIDPPFATGADFSIPVAVGEEAFTKEPSLIELKAYRDTWGVSPDERARGVTEVDKYLAWIYGALVPLRDLLKETGSIYVHLDPGMSHYAKLVMDEVFGAANFRSELIWKRTSAHSSARRWGPVHDVLLFYTKGDSYTWNPQFLPLPEETIDQWYNNVEPDGRRFNRADLTAAGIRTGPSGRPWRGIDPTLKGRHWAVPSLDVVQGLETQAALDRLDAEGRIFWPKREDGVPMLKRYVDESKGIPAQDVISDIYVNNIAAERVGYPTQKPEALLERIILSSSNPGDLVLDCMAGSGTTAAVAERLLRRWIAADLSRFAVHTTRKRVLSLPGVKPFVVQNLGKYERQAWQRAEFSDDAASRELAYRNFILKLYGATQLKGHVWLHGARGGRMVHVGAVDAPVSPDDVKAIVAEFKRAIGKGAGSPKTRGIDVLGWDFAFEINEISRQQAAAAGIDLRIARIPREVMDRRAIEQGDVQFFELASLDVAAKVRGRSVSVALEKFVIPAEDVPEEVRRAVRDWTQWIDYWAVDWNYRDDTFHNEWQTYRTRRSATVERKTAHTYDAAGTYTVVVKVVDILGNDTTKALPVVVK